MILLDSDCIIDFLRAKEKAVEIISKNKDNITTTEINKFEVFLGAYLKKNNAENELKNTEWFFNNLSVLPFDAGCGQISAKVLANLMLVGDQINQNDCLIASVMIKNGIDSIISNNRKDFSRIKGINVISY
ncbi:MAG: type II toxin-antitoxin system VapC family toxin [Nanoarchaeota archaeon]